MSEKIEAMGWFIEGKYGVVKSVSKIHWTRDGGDKTLCGRRPSRNAVMDPMGFEGCEKCEDIREKAKEGEAI